jgi:hypothetical protein
MADKQFSVEVSITIEGTIQIDAEDEDAAVKEAEDIYADDVNLDVTSEDIEVTNVKEL